MSTAFNTCREDLRESIIDFIWNQYGVLGVGSSSSAVLPWFIDPEPLLLFSITVARHDPRVFDEILDWLIANERWINVRRLMTLMKQDAVVEPRLVRAVAETVAVNTGKGSRWRFDESQWKTKDAPDPLFILDGRPWSSAGVADLTFLKYGYQRSPLSLRNMSRRVPMHEPRCIAFLMRTMCGVNARADLMTLLAVRKYGHPSEIARLLGYSQRGLNEVIVEVGTSPLVGVRQDGNKKVYRWEHKNWWRLLYEKDVRPPCWIDWRALVRGLTALWRGIVEPSEQITSDYTASSLARRAMRAARRDIEDSGIGAAPEDDRPHHAEEYLAVFVRDVRQLAKCLIDGGSFTPTR